jgi:hypothetical protein
VTPPIYPGSEISGLPSPVVFVQAAGLKTAPIFSKWRTYGLGRIFYSKITGIFSNGTIHHIRILFMPIRTKAKFFIGSIILPTYFEI